MLLADGKVAKVGKGLEDEAAEIIDAAEKIVSPGIIDMHVHGREPGQEQKETIKTASEAAARGGVTTCILMPNTVPPADNKVVVGYMQKRIAESAIVNMYPTGAVGKNLESEELAPLAELKDAGVIAFTNDGKPFANADLLRKALLYAKMLGLPILSHCEDSRLSGEGCMHEGRVSTRLGLPGIPAASEYAQVAKEMMLAHSVRAPLHFMHLSAKESFDLIRWAKKYGINITCETAPHYFSVIDEAVELYNANAKVNPPLKSREDVEAVSKALADDTIDVIATDHAPHAALDKSVEFQNCANGLVGLETLVGLVFTKLVHSKKLKLSQAIAKMTANPAKVLGLKNKGHLGQGADADVAIIDPDKNWIVDPQKFASKGRNTPFAGMKLKGQAVMTIIGGRVVMRDGKIY